MEYKYLNIEYNWIWEWFALLQWSLRFVV